MSPRRGGGSGPDGSDSPDRAALEQLRARMAAAGRPSTRRTPKRAMRRWDTGEPPLEAPTPLDEPAAGGEPAAGEGPWWDDHPGRPIPVEGGIVAATRRGRIGATWWSQRFLGALEAVLVGGRMERGRSYARKGQVVSMTLGAGLVEAVVQGSRDEPYRARLSMPVVTDEEWAHIVAALGAQARYAASLLAGELPHEVEEVFEQVGASLFPAPHARLVTECTCPDFENPCKHVAAVCYLLAESFDRDPFRVLEWRGRDRRWVVEALRRLRGGAPDDAAAQGASPGSPQAGPTPAGTQTPADPGEPAGEPEPEADAEAELPSDGFWDAGPGLAEVHVRPAPAELPGAVLRQLPRDLVQVRGGDLADVLTPAYEALAAEAVKTATGGH